MSVQAITCAMALRGVSPTEKLLLLALANYADDRMQCFPSQKRLAADTCLTDRTVRALLASLEAQKIISRTRQDRYDGSRSTDVITLHFAGLVLTNSEEGGAEIISGGAEAASRGVRKHVPGGAEAASALTTFEPSSEPSIEPEARASRLSDDWQPTQLDIAFAEKRGMSPSRIADEALKFLNYWQSKPGKDGRKLNWSRTWQNWVITATEERQHGPPKKRVGFV